MSMKLLIDHTQVRLYFFDRRQYLSLQATTRLEIKCLCCAQDVHKKL